MGWGVRCIKYLRTAYGKLTISKKLLRAHYQTSMKHEVYCYKKQFHPAVTQELITCNAREDGLLLANQHSVFYKKCINKNLRIYIHSNYHDPPTNRKCHFTDNKDVFINNERWYDLK